MIFEDFENSEKLKIHENMDFLSFKRQTLAAGAFFLRFKRQTAAAGAFFLSFKRQTPAAGAPIEESSFKRTPFCLKTIPILISASKTLFLTLETQKIHIFKNFKIF